MGVPGFVAWLRDSFRDKMILTSLRDKVKILYIDGNCLVHPKCFEVIANITDKHITNDKLMELMFKRICNFINYLISYVNPEICFFAIDGVGPAAKINQQRFRRYKSMIDNKLKNKIKEKHKKKTLIEWNNTVITPGTDFMIKLDNHLKKYFGEHRKNNPNIQYIYSSYIEPGEGEHKIVDHLRRLSGNDVSVIYGLDADLFFLSMCCNKKNIYLLREEQQFLNGVVQKHEIIDIVDDVAEDMRYVSIDITNECYDIKMKKIVEKRIEQIEQNEQNMQNMQNIQNKTFNKIIDKINKSEIDKIKLRENYCSDFVFLCYLLGNDFIPHLPTINIKKNGLDIIIDAYVDTFLIIGFPLVEIITELNDETNKIKRSVRVNNVFFLELLRVIGDLEEVFYNELIPKYEYRNSKRKCQSMDPYNIEIWELENIRNLDKYDPIKCGYGSKDVWKFRYYEYYFGVSEHYDDFIKLISKMYIEGLKWVTEYYYNGCPSWKWKYPFIQSPFISDIYKFLVATKFDINNIVFNIGEPLTPEMQLLSVLPRSCADLVPKKYTHLMISNKSPIIDMYPIEVDLDIIHKDMFWECTPKLPYLDIDRIIEAVTSIKSKSNQAKKD